MRLVFDFSWWLGGGGGDGDGRKALFPLKREKK